MGDFKAANAASEKIFAPSGTADRGERGSLFVLDPATGTLEVRADLRLKAGSSFRAEARHIQLRLYISLSRLYLRKFGLQAKHAALHLAGKLCSYLLDFATD